MTQSMARALKRSNPKIRRRSISIPNIGYWSLVFGVPDSHAQTVGRTRLRRQYTNKLNPNAIAALSRCIVKYKGHPASCDTSQLADNLVSGRANML